MSRPATRATGLTGYHSPQVEVDVRLNTNESPLPPPAGWFEAMHRAIDGLTPHRYPDRSALQLRERIGAAHGLGAENVWCANGSNEVIQTLLLAFGGEGRTAVTFEPTYALHSHISRITGTAVRSGVRNAEDFTLSAAEVQKHAPGSAVCFTCSPNNPTGVVDGPEVLAAALQHSSGLVMVDEAYGQFATSSAVGSVGEHENLVVLRTFSKTWAMAGVRLGYLVASPWVIQAMESAALPYHLSSLTQAAGLSALAFDAEMRERIDMLVHERERVARELGSLPVRQWPSQANFILFRPTGVAGADVWQRLVDRSVLIRDTSSWSGLEGCLRVTVGTPDENDKFLNALQEVLQ